MRPKGKLFALFAVFAAIGLVTASGAFTSVQAERTAEVNVAGDANALLAIEPSDNGQNGAQYAQNNSGDVEISLNGDFQDNSGENANARGINENATTHVDYVINVTNQGSQTVYLEIERTGGHPSVVSFYNGTVDSGTNITAGANNAELGIGETAQISMKMDTRGTNFTQNDDIINQITLVANETAP